MVIIRAWHSFKLSRPNLKLSSLPPRNRLLSVDRPSQLHSNYPIATPKSPPIQNLKPDRPGKTSGTSQDQKPQPLPILKQHATNVGYVTRILARDRQQIATSELNRWLSKQVFDRTQLDGFVEAQQQTDWMSAIAVIDRVYGGDHSWTAKIPSSLLAELASKRLKNQTELDELLTLLGYRIAEEEDVAVASQLLNGAVQASLSFGNVVVCGELVNYAICFSTEIARVEIEKKSSPINHATNLPNHSSSRPPDSTLALKPLLSVIAALMSQPAARNKTPTFRLLGHLVKALINLCGSLPSALNRLSKPNVHLVCRAIITSILSPEGHSIKREEVDEILKQKLPASTLRLAMVAMIHIGDRDRATEIEKMIRKNRKETDRHDPKIELDLAFHQVRRDAIRAYSSSEKLHKQFIHKLRSVEGPGRPPDAAVETYTSYMSTLFRHHLPKMALQVWERMIDKEVVPDAAAIQVAMTIYIDLSRPAEAVEVFDRFVSRQKLLLDTNPEASVQSGDLVNLQLLSTYARALDISGRYSDVYKLWKGFRTDWKLEPDTRIFSTLLSSARKITRYSMAPVSNAMLTSSSDPDQYAEQRVEEDLWEGEPAGEVAMRLFWTVLYENWASLAETVRAPVLPGSMWNSSPTSMHVRILNMLCGLKSLPSMPASISRSSDPQDKARSKIAATIIPSLSYTTRWTKIIPNRSCFKDMIELLALNDQTELIPLLLSWMKTIGVKPNQDLLIRAYYYIYQSSAITHRLTGLDEFVEGWIQEIDGQVIIHDDYEDEQIQEELGNLQNPDQRTTPYRNQHPYKHRPWKLIIPTEQMIQTHHVQAAKWSDRFYLANVRM
ncbi:hypothetical protein MJO28_004779 [Puccinia striiformis f. sp. tritici]|uniref:Pentacotripeptide-repeat region of PRORP domain-containing protein n=3 Tax=Puccinia striiformis TaxID=27350 RepID=A0A0L0VMP0_9BASI|nr:uncharacterized protein Pst134EA_032983 [Puccinia striiformis f. sp. tritici]XP_047807928.1 hypothetical protein Pst134EA_009017 [Puccinia striiformis f. sp. tritici]KNF00548.1 hypothetical protein PSTG_06240 [Puccinia striiformis f. sp. tritici PST-78]POW03234.1 hypothetical protein PSTT_11301 [Puccinia striiformis]KAH9440850.1 hypothetical protein Pst134EA_032983 [Puccinia striiformis f. sp. tritici]KAH9457722.1 hypothetical protein Pst134EB_010039 [Puccinia striiformis f. sp. tritici]KA